MFRTVKRFINLVFCILRYSLWVTSDPMVRDDKELYILRLPKSTYFNNILNLLFIENVSIIKLACSLLSKIFFMTCDPIYCGWVIYFFNEFFINNAKA